MVAFNHQINLTRFKDLYPFDSHFLDLNGLAYHYIDEGQGEPILMLHGNPTWSFFYRELVKAFSCQYRTIVPDHIGCGLSSKPNTHEYDFRLKSRIADLDALMTHLNIGNNISLIVHDWGGMIGVSWALNHLCQVHSKKIKINPQPSRLGYSGSVGIKSFCFRSPVVLSP